MVVYGVWIWIWIWLHLNLIRKAATFGIQNMALVPEFVPLSLSFRLLRYSIFLYSDFAIAFLHHGFGLHGLLLPLIRSYLAVSVSSSGRLHGSCGQLLSCWYFLHDMY